MFVQTVVSLVFLVFLLVTLASVINGAPMVYTDSKKVKKILVFLEPVKGKKIIDLGSGDGRIVIQLAARGARAYGVEINPLLVILSRVLAKVNGVSRNATFYWGNFWNINLSDFDAVIIYGISHIMQRLEIKFGKELKKGSLVVSNAYKFPGWKAIKNEEGIFFYKKKL